MEENMVEEDRKKERKGQRWEHKKGWKEERTNTGFTNL